MLDNNELNEYSTAFIGVGSNIEDRYTNIKEAEKEINKSKFCEIVQVSKIYETEPVGYLDQDNFLNCVFELKTVFSPNDLIKFLLNIEKKLKRERIIHWGPRTIDLDIIFYNNIVVSTANLEIPHPRMAERMFVLKPLCDLEPDYIHPVIHKPCSSIAEELELTQKIPEEWIPSS